MWNRKSSGSTLAAHWYMSFSRKTTLGSQLLAEPATPCPDPPFLKRASTAPLLRQAWLASYTYKGTPPACPCQKINWKLLEQITKFTFNQELEYWPGKLTLWQKHLPCKCEDQSLSPRTCINLGLVVSIFNSWAPPRKRGDEDKRLPRRSSANTHETHSSIPFFNEKMK